MNEDQIKINNELINNFLELNYNLGTELKYHCDWNWLMPVIEKCYSSKDNDEMNEITDKFDFWQMNKMYDAVIQYILWHNEQNTY